MLMQRYEKFLYVVRRGAIFCERGRENYDEIAEALGYKNRSTVCKLLKRYEEE
jgi:hypothetical protein